MSDMQTGVRVLGSATFVGGRAFGDFAFGDGLFGDVSATRILAGGRTRAIPVIDEGAQDATSDGRKFGDLNFGDAVFGSGR